MIFLRMFEKMNTPTTQSTTIRMSARGEDKWFIDGVWDVMDRFFNKYGLVSHQTESYAWFTDIFCPQFVENFPEIKMLDSIKNVQHTVKFTNFQMNQPALQEYESVSDKLTPLECRMRNFTYAGKAYVDLIHTQQTSKGPLVNHHRNIPIGEIPIMVKSNKCILWDSNLGRPKSDAEICELDESPQDTGGYFLMKGGERVLIAQDTMSTNYVHVSEKDGMMRGEIRSANEVGKQTTVMIRWTQNKKFGKVVRITLPFIKQDVPLVVLFRALGVTSREEIMNYIFLGEDDEEIQQMLDSSFDEMNIIQDQEAALYFITIHAISDMKGQNVQEQCEKAKSYLRKEFFPHIKEGPMWEIRKAYFLGYMVRRLLYVIQGRLEEDDRDHYKNKRVETSGVLLSTLFQDRFKKMVSDLRKHMHNCFSKGNQILFRQGIKKKFIKTGLANAMKTGNWNPNKHSNSKNKSSSKQGVSQVLNRLTPQATNSHLRRINTPMGKEGAQQKARQLHTTHWGILSF